MYGGVEIFFAPRPAVRVSGFPSDVVLHIFLFLSPMPSPVVRGRMWSGAEHAPRTPFPPSTKPHARDLLLKKCSAAVFSKAIHGHAPPLQHRRCARSGARGHRKQPSANPHRPLRRRYPTEGDFRGGTHRKSSEGRVMPPHMLPSPKTGLSLISRTTFLFHCESAGLSDGRDGQDGDGAELTGLAETRDG